MSPQAGADASPTSDPKHFCDCGTASLPSLPSLLFPCWAWSTICHSGGDFILRHKTSPTVRWKCHRCGKCYVSDWGWCTVISVDQCELYLGVSFHDDCESLIGLPPSSFLSSTLTPPFSSSSHYLFLSFPSHLFFLVSWCSLNVTNHWPRSDPRGPHLLVRPRTEQRNSARRNEKCTCPKRLWTPTTMTNLRNTIICAFNAE